MHSKLLFLLLVIVIAAVAVFAAYHGPKNAIQVLKKRKNVLVGIVVFTLGLGLLVLAMPTSSDDEIPGEFFAYSEVYLGLDYLDDVSPQCVPGQYDDRATSHGGFKQNLYVSADRRLHLNVKVVHHSCAFESDRNTYDAVGLEVRYRTDCILLFICP